MKRVKPFIILLIGMAFIFLGSCSKKGAPTQPEDEHWFGSRNVEVTWFEFENYCDRRIAPSQETADLYCQGHNYVRAAGYTTANCYVGGEKRSYISRIACTLEN